MNIIDVSRPSSYELASKEAALQLLKDGVVIYPTDTLYGVGVNALDQFMVERLFKMKDRPKDKAVPIMVSSVAMAKTLARIADKYEPLLTELWPGPFTLVFEKKPIVPEELTGGKKTVALRMPDHPLCQSILRDFEGPITTTSANISGEEPLTSGEDIVRRFEGREHAPDLLLDSGELEDTHPSTVIDMTKQSPKILRIDPTNKERLMNILSIMR